MTGRLFSLAACLVSCLIYALSAGAAIFYLFALCLFLMLSYSLISILLARRFVRFSLHTDKRKIERGESISIRFFLKRPFLLPIAPVRLYFDELTRYLTGESSVSLHLDGKTRSFGSAFSLPHVGEFQIGVERLVFQDILGLFALSKTKQLPFMRILSLPRDFALPALIPNKSYDGKPLLNQTGEDVNAPDDVRGARPGDSIKRIHWKLSARTKSLIVRRFEVPSPPETLLYVNLELPKNETPENLLYIKDGLLETALALAKAQLQEGYSIVLPLSFDKKSEIGVTHASMLPLFQESLARIDFDRPFSFVSELSRGLLRAKKTASIAIVTSLLDAAVVEGIVHLRKTGPKIRVFLMGDEDKNKAYLPLIARLRHALVEVCYVC